jgi:hypothetical protein
MHFCSEDSEKFFELGLYWNFTERNMKTMNDKFPLFKIIICHSPFGRSPRTLVKWAVGQQANPVTNTSVTA